MKHQNSTPLPNNFLAEQAILNLLLTNSSLIKEAVLDLKSESFYFEEHKLIFETIYDLYEKNTLINLITVVTSLQDKNILTKIGGIPKINAIIDEAVDLADDLMARVNNLKNINNRKEMKAHFSKIAEDLENKTEGFIKKLNALS